MFSLPSLVGAGLRGSALRAPQDGLEAPPTPPPPKAPLGGPGLVGLGSSPAGTWLTL